MGYIEIKEIDGGSIIMWFGILIVEYGMLRHYTNLFVKNFDYNILSVFVLLIEMLIVLLVNFLAINGTNFYNIKKIEVKTE